MGKGLKGLESEVKIYTTKDLAEIFGASDETIRREIKRKRLNCFYVGNEARFTQAHLEDYMNVRNLGKTTRELQLEAEKEQLLEVIKTKDQVIESIKNVLLKSI
ncbi:helix-turn-helix domain-containing protein [Tissierella sp.]|uniref:helix-turn-helix domain-containing protein n=1 Tax=Tissierella sp. TaxID=41274 RepID=UPI0028A9D3DD|nr:helix-turn-helix domain-containing protein [Tissierella sp.]